MTLGNRSAQTLFFLDRPMILGFKEICWSMFTVRTQRFIFLRHWKTAQVKLPPLTCNIWSVFSAFWMKALLCPWQPGSSGIILVLFPQWHKQPSYFTHCDWGKSCTLLGSSWHSWKSTECTVGREKANDSGEYQYKIELSIQNNVPRESQRFCVGGGSAEFSQSEQRQIPT